GELDASSMAIIHNAPFALGGKWLLDVPELTLENLEHVSGARGRLVWQEAAGRLPQAMPFGPRPAELGQAAGWWRPRRQEQGRPLGRRGDAGWRPGRPRKINAELQARADAEPALASGLGLLGRADNQGWIRWRAQLQ